MTVSSTPRVAGPFTGNGATTVFPFGFKVFASADVSVKMTDLLGVTTVVSAGLSVTINADQTTAPGGSVTLTTALPTGYTLIILGAIEESQPVDLVNSGSFNADSIEQGLDRLAMQTQEVALRAGAALRLPPNEATADLAPAAFRTDRLLGFDPISGLPTLSGFTMTQLASMVGAALNGTTSAATITYVGPDGNPLEARTLQDKGRDVISAKDFIRATDTSPDQWINRALAYAGTQVKSIIPTKVDLVTARVYLPPALYRTAATIVVPEGVVGEGDSSATAVLWPTFTGVAVQIGDGTREISSAGLRRIGILGNYAGTLGTYQAWSSATTVGVLMNKCIRACGLDEVLVAACQVGVKTVGSFQWHIRDSYFVYHLTNYVWADNGTASAITGTRFDWCEGPIGVFVDGTGASNETVGFHMSGGAVQLCWGSGVGLFDVTSATFDGIHFEGNYRLAVDGTTHVYADIDIAPGPNARGRAFSVDSCFFTPGTSPAVQAYTAIRCSKANVLVTSANTVRDSHYYRAVDVLSGPAAVARLVGIGNDFSGAAGKYAYDPTVTDVNIEEQDGVGVKTISKVRLGGLRLIAGVSGSNLVTDGIKADYYISTAAGDRTLSLRDTECVAGATILVTKTSADTNTLTVNTVLADGVTASSKTINGAAFAAFTGAYGSFMMGCDGTNWYARNVGAAQVGGTGGGGGGGGGGGNLLFPALNVYAGNASPNQATAGVQFNTDGTTSRKINSGSYTVASAYNYYDPITPGIGSTVSIKVHQTAGSPLTTGLLDTWQTIASARQYTLVGVGGYKTFDGVVSYSLDGGATIAGTGTLHLEAETTF